MTPTVAYNTLNQVSWASGLAPGTYQYDAAGDVVNDGVNAYAYDADGLRVAKGAPSAWPAPRTICAILNPTPTPKYKFLKVSNQFFSIPQAASRSAQVVDLASLSVLLTDRLKVRFLPRPPI